MRVVIHWAIAVVWLLFPVLGHADEVPGGRLLIIGGGLRPHNSAVYERMIADAGGRERARFGILPTALVLLASNGGIADASSAVTCST